MHMEKISLLIIYLVRIYRNKIHELMGFNIVDMTITGVYLARSVGSTLNRGLCFCG